MTKKHGSESPETSDENGDSGLFRRLMADARPLRHSPRAAVPRRVKARAKFRRDDEREVLRESLEHDAHRSEVSSGDGLRFRRPAIGHRTMRKLARGGYSVQAELDLHGMTVVEAGSALREFVNECCLRGLGCVRIVHGKGLGSGERGPILKRMLDATLRRWDQVLAFVSTRQVDGGTGAVYVLLKID
ncbi:MAG: Smr/MutS family protein [Gammaproteobacteria bacterium]|nr:Smr/MutS family protein [Gammaproteobacteria bacterium]MDH4313551.1 Smr/MutS family protein [Gammaproteobacteria bacterium]MDH5212620.1 Smr/MutS family protein [Gammaproteobacteria bacterium]